MTGAIEAGLVLATEVLKLINTENARKHENRIVDLKKQLLEEENKGQQAVDSRIEMLYQELQIELEAAKNEIVSAFRASATSA